MVQQSPGTGLAKAKLSGVKASVMCFWKKELSPILNTRALVNINRRVVHRRIILT